MKDGESTMMAVAKDNPTGGSMNECPVHGQLVRDHERRMDELKEHDEKIFDTISDVKQKCQDNRKTCQDGMWGAINQKPKTVTLISLAGIIIGIVVIIFSLFSSKINTSLEALHATDMEVKEALAIDKKQAEESRKEMTNKMQDIYVMMIQIGGKPPKKNRNDVRE
jgi:hypothetical protein